MANRIKPAGWTVIGLLVIGLSVAGYTGWRHFAGADAQETTEDPVPVVDKGARALATPDGQPRPVAVPGKSKYDCGGQGERPCVVCLSQWPGHMAGILAVGGLTTQPQSFAARVMSVINPASGSGLNVAVKFIEEPDNKNAALKTGDCDAVWQTTDEMPINMGGFTAPGMAAQSFVQIDWSRGGDGCAADEAVKTPRDMLTRRGAVLKYSPDHTVAEFWFTNSDLTPQELARVRANMSFSMNDWTYARNLFCQGQIDLACLWEPDLQQALACRPGAHLVFSTKDADTLVADNLLALVAALQARPDIYEKIARIFLEGAKIGQANPSAAARLISTVAPRFRDEIKYEGTLASFGWVRWNDLGDNVAYFGLDGTPAKFDAAYKQADMIWSEYIEEGKPVLEQRFSPSTLRFGGIIKAIYDSERASAPSVPIVAEQPVYAPSVIAKAAPKMVKPVTINFDTGKWDLDPGAIAILKRDVLSQVGLAQGMGLRIEGNTDDVGSRASNVTLSQRRAESVRAYLVSQGIPMARVVPQGNGPDNPTCNMKTPDCRAANRRTDIVFVQGN